MVSGHCLAGGPRTVTPTDLLVVLLPRVGFIYGLPETPAVRAPRLHKHLIYGLPETPTVRAPRLHQHLIYGLPETPAVRAPRLHQHLIYGLPETPAVRAPRLHQHSDGGRWQGRHTEDSVITTIR